MGFEWPIALWLLAAIPSMVAAYAFALKRRKKLALKFPSLSLVHQAMGPRQKFRRHVPPLLFLLAMAAVIVGIARPTATLTLPSNQQTVLLAIDVSLSMRAADVEPNRLSAAQVAAKAFVEELPPTLKVGILSFAGTAALVQSPTRNKEELIAAIDRFQLQRGTATGSAILLALATLFPDGGYDLESAVFGPNFGRDRTRDPDRAVKQEKKEVAPVPPGSYTSAAIVLLSDGRRTTGPDPMAMAKLAADRGVRVFTVGFGTQQGAAVDFGGWSIYMRLDEEALKAVASITKGEYFYAGTAADLRKVYEQLNTRFGMEKVDTEITALFAGLAALLAIIAGVLSVLWFSRAG